jgi:hypothetical protein
MNMDLLYLIVLTLSLHVGGTGPMEEGPAYPGGHASRQVVLAGSSVGEARERLRSANKTFKAAIPHVVMTATCYEVALKAGTLREIPCP